MVSRRSLLLTGAGLVAVAGAGAVVATGSVDEIAGAMGLDPKPLPDPGDERLAAAARADATALAALVGGAAPDDVVAALAEHLATLPGGEAGTPSTELGDEPAAACRAVAAAREADVARAVSPDLKVVLASMSAGLHQCAAAIEAA